MSPLLLAYAFSQKAKVNAEFSLAALKGMGSSASAPRGNPVIGLFPTLGLQTASQLILEGIELLLKALALMRFNTPSSEHSLKKLFGCLHPSDKKLIERIVQTAIAKSSTGSVPFGLRNIASGTVMGGPLRAPDPTGGYGSGMNAEHFFALLDAEWKSEKSQYLGADTRFVTHGTLRANTRVLAGSIYTCSELAKVAIERIEKLTQRRPK